MEILVLIMALAWYQLGIMFLCFLILCIAWSKESALGAFISLIGVSVILSFTGVTIITWSGVVSSIYAILGFIVIGLIWSRFKWGRYVNKEIEDLKSRDWKKDDIIEHIKDSKDHDIISFWILMWPLSIAGFLFGDLVQELVKSIGSYFDSVVDSSVNKRMK